jgi:RHS repeat-associated protein
MKRIIAKIFLMIFLLLGGLYYAAPSLASAGEMRTFKLEKGRSAQFHIQDLDVEVPADAGVTEISAQEIETDLSGINVPPGFKALRAFRFGPHGARFRSPIKARLKFDAQMIPSGYSLDDVRLYYINREEKRLEILRGQIFSKEDSRLIALLTHFSDYTVGVAGGWDGKGINPFMDYTHNGPVYINLYERQPKIFMPMYSFPGKGRDTFLELNSTYHGFLDTSWNVSSLYFDMYSGTLYLPGGASYYIPLDGPASANTTVTYKEDGIPIIATYTGGNPGHHNAHSDADPVPSRLVKITLADGTQITWNSGKEIITDPNGNQIQCNITVLISNHIGGKESDVYEKVGGVTSMIDSSNRTFKFSYSVSKGTVFLQKIEQLLSDGSYKTIMSFTRSDKTSIITDSLGRVTKYTEYTDSSYINYPNGSSVKLTYGSEWDKRSYLYNVLQKQEFYQPNQTQPYRTITYSGTVHSYTDVNDGVTRTRYTFDDKGNTTKTEVYDLNSQLQKTITYAGIVNRHPGSVSVQYATGGVLGTAATTKYEYDDWLNTTRVLDPYGAETRMAYANTNSNKNLSQFNTAYQNALYTTAAGYDRLLTKATLVHDPVHSTNQLNQSHYQYDSKGNLLMERNWTNNTYLDTKYTYDAYGNVLSKTDANGNILNFEYRSDAPYNSAYLTAVKRSDGTILAGYDYDTNLGRRIRATDPKGNIFTYQYDAVGRMTQAQQLDSAVGITKKITYLDAESRVELQYGNTGQWQYGRIDYDPLLGKPVKIQRQQNGQWVIQREFGYDANGRLAWEKGNLPNRTNHRYDALGREIQTQYPDGSSVTRAWADRQLTITDGNGNQSIQQYDLMDRLTQTVRKADANTAYTTTSIYDTASHVVQTTNARSAKTTYSYDNLGRLTKVEYPQDGTNPMAAESYTYDNVGNLKTKTAGSRTKTLGYEFFAGYRLKTVTEPDRTVTYTYDNNDNPLTQTVSNGMSYTYAYDSRNRMTNMTANLDGRSFPFAYSYDLFDRMTAISYPGRTAPVSYQYDELDRLQKIPGFVNSCSYDGDNQLLQMAYANGVANGYTYDGNGRPTNINAGTLLNLSYTYDAAGNIIRINNDYYNYDGLNRLVWYGNKPLSQISAATGTRWSYDGAGNMTGKEKFLNGASQGATSFSYDLANRLWKMGTTTYANDAFGSRTGKTNGDTWQYIYDGESRLTRVTRNGATQLDSAYDGTGMRVKKVENGKTTYYIYAGANPLLEYSDGKYLYRIYAGNHAIAEESGGVVKYYHKDHLGSTRIVTSAAGAKLAEYKFAPYGEKELASGDGTAYQFTDKAEDATTGLDYFGFRFYDPEVGRFITQDPIKDGANWFAYCYDNPINFVDPDGLRVVLGDPGTAGTSREFSGHFDRNGDFHTDHTPDGSHTDVHFSDHGHEITSHTTYRNGSSVVSNTILNSNMSKIVTTANYYYSKTGQYLGYFKTDYCTTGDSIFYTKTIKFNALTGKYTTVNGDPYQDDTDFDKFFTSPRGNIVTTFGPVILKKVMPSLLTKALSNPVTGVFVGIFFGSEKVE